MTELERDGETRESRRPGPAATRASCASGSLHIESYAENDLASAMYLTRLFRFSRAWTPLGNERGRTSQTRNRPGSRCGV